jgi:7,8-dihydropterin-6-yl-methyl-4-(beta-D-ribofuranosyl)aminobenzene 5'-phosphate synthase
MDNSIDVLMASTEIVRRAPRDAILGGPKSRLRAEHGFSTLVTVVKDGRRHSILFDAGLTQDGLVQNMGILEVKAADLRAIVLSHGHGDHTMGLLGMLRERGRGKLPLVIHPEAFRLRKIVLPDGDETRALRALTRAREDLAAAAASGPLRPGRRSPSGRASLLRPAAGSRLPRRTRSRRR